MKNKNFFSKPESNAKAIRQTYHFSQNSRKIDIVKITPS